MKDWRKIEEIFGRALQLELGARHAYFDQACGEDSELRREVASLLASHDDASATFLGQPAPVSAGLTPPAPPASGESVGSYRLLDKIGEGGMATVYLGERADGAFDRQVAVKVLRRGMEGGAERTRFDLERQILASLDHPGIARLLDGGTTAAGSPYVVMELVDGEPIDRYCDRHGLSVADRIDLFLAVCDAVASAHRSLVVHRDLKPSNILVDREDRVKLLDFGIAKILDPEQIGGMAGETTASWQRLLTPGYASPEQVRGERVTVATDVYLLGIVLYKLLTGRLPHRFPSRSLVEVEVVLTREQPRPPSRVPREIGSQPGDEADPSPRGVEDIDPDLDHIVLKALRGDPAERYGSVVELIEDLRRFRQGLPIRARSGSRRYRARKFVRRHWRGLVSAGLVFGLLTLFAVDRAIQVQQRDLALGRAEASLARSEAMWDLVEGLFWSAEPQASKGRLVTVQEALARGEEKLVRGGVGSHAVEALTYALFGRIRLGLGDYDSAYSNLEQALERFDAVPATEESLRIGELRAKGDFALAQLHQIGSLNDDGAEEVVAAAIRDARQVYRASRPFEASDPALALELSSPLAQIYCDLGRWQDVAPLTEEAMALVRRAGEAKTLAVAQALGRRALVLKNLEGDLEGARAHYSEALAIYLEHEGPVHPEVAKLHNQLGLIAATLGDTDAALTFHRDALEVRQQLYPDGHLDISQSHFHLGSIFRRQGAVDRAIEHFREMARVSHQAYGPTHRWTVRRTLWLCEVLIEGSRFAEAEDLLRVELGPQHRAARPASSRLITQAEGLLGAALLAQGQIAGEPLLRQSLKTLRGKPSGFGDVIRWLENFLDKNLPAG